MPWPLREISGYAELDRIIDERGERATIGCYWRQESIDDAGVRSSQVIVILPPGAYTGQFRPYHVYPNDQRWSVDGEWPQVTISPSINCVGSYHGYIRDGVITDDVEGRTFA